MCVRVYNAGKGELDAGVRRKKKVCLHKLCLIVLKESEGMKQGERGWRGDGGRETKMDTKGQAAMVGLVFAFIILGSCCVSFSPENSREGHCDSLIGLG